MTQKRPFDDEVVNGDSSKHPRQDGPTDKTGSCNNSFPLEHSSRKFCDIGESSIGKHELRFREELENSIYPVVSRDLVEDIESDGPRSVSLSHWATSSPTDEVGPADEVAHLPLCSRYFSFDRPVKPIVNPKDVYYFLLDYPPQKRVSVGPNHQANIPSWQPQVNRTISDNFGTDETLYYDNNSSGVVVLPFLETENLPNNSQKDGFGRAECICSDRGSVRCVRQHILESREKLKKIIGHDKFTELGFDGMGEVVANKWSEEEEHLFHEVVYYNPVSLGKNFWHVLFAVFSTRTKMEIVSYYFNVFMLRKRAQQNRSVLINVDSDNDEWEGSAYERGVSEEDEDSGIESPVRHDIPGFYQNGLHFHDNEHELELEDEIEEGDYNNGDNSDLEKPGIDSAFETLGKKSDNEVENDVQDGSCTSSDSGTSIEGSRSKSDGYQVWNNYMIDSSDVKMWDGYSLSCPKQSVEFLPTCSMIEEVFGEGEFESKSKT